MIFETVTIGDCTLIQLNDCGVNERVQRGSLPASFRFCCLPYRHSNGAQLHRATSCDQDASPLLRGVPVLDICRPVLSLSLRTHSHRVFCLLDSLGDLFHRRLQSRVAGIRNSWLALVSMSEIAQFLFCRNRTSNPKDGLCETRLGFVLNRSAQQDDQSEALKYQELTVAGYLMRCM